MQLNRVIITNFRSIKECTITFNKSLQVLVGINEAGKSNILKALTLIDPDTELTKNDIRDPLPEEENADTSSVRFVFSLTVEEQKEIEEKIKVKILAKDKSSNMTTIGETEINLYGFIKHKQEGMYTVNLIKQTRQAQHWTLIGPKYRILPEWKKVIQGKSQELLLGKDVINLSNYDFVNTRDFPEIDTSNLEALDITKLNNYVGQCFIELIKLKLPKCISWSYKESYLLPGKVNLAVFRKDPSTCLPLKIMFNLAKYENIIKTIDEAEAKTNGLKNLLKRVSETTTMHMKKVWPEWSKLKVHVVQNGEFIEAGIEDEFNFYSLERRSDGFKRFFTFLLMMSAQSKTNEVQNTIILIDEPEGGLHPSGQTYLKDELIKISKNNTILIATHSIFMIDREQVDRHIIVSKKKEITTINPVESSNITEEEVLFKALGFSIFELIRPRNIIFEGWRDKKTFDIFTKSKSTLPHDMKKQISALGLLHALGVKDISRIANICENINREYIILSDADKPAVEKKRDFTGSGQWVMYSEIDGVNAITTEDFIIKKTINTAIKIAFKRYGIAQPFAINDEHEVDCVAKIESHLKSLDDSSLDKKKIINEIKDVIMENLKPEDLNQSYQNVVNHIAEKLSK